MLSPTQGSLDSESAAQIIYKLVAAHASGLLFLQDAGRTAAVAIYFADGRLINAESNLREHSLQQQLLQDSALSANAIDAAVQKVEPGRSLVDILVDSRSISASDIERHCRATASRIVAAVVPWTDGTYAFQEGNFTAKGQYDLQTPKLLLQAIAQLPEQHAGLQRFRSDRRCLVRHDQDVVGYESTTKELIATVDGKSAASDLAAAADDEDAAIRLLYGLLLAGTMQHGTTVAEPRPRPSGARSARATTSTAKGARPRQSAKASSGQPPPTPAAAKAVPESRPLAQPIAADELQRATAGFAPLEPWQNDRLRELDRLFAAASSQDILKCLEIPTTADEIAFDDAFHRAADPFHPRQNQWIADETARTKLAFVHAKLTAAYKTVRGRAPAGPSLEGFDAESVKEKRREFTKTDRQREAERLAHDAARHFASGQRLFEAKRYHDARVEAQLALKAMPDEAPYHALIASIDMLNPNIRWQKESEQHWARACELDPWNAEYRVGLAEVYKCQRLMQKARREFINALELDPANEKALAEVPRAERPKPKAQPAQHNPE